MLEELGAGSQPIEEDFDHETMDEIWVPNPHPEPYDMIHIIPTPESEHGPHYRTYYP